MPSLKDKTVLIIGRGSGIARARGAYRDLTASTVNASFGTKVTGPLLLAKHFGGSVAPGGSFLFMPGAIALKPAPGMLAVAATNAAVPPGASAPPTTSRRWRSRSWPTDT